MQTSGISAPSGKKFGKGGSGSGGKQGTHAPKGVVGGGDLEVIEKVEVRLGHDAIEIEMSEAMKTIDAWGQESEYLTQATFTVHLVRYVLSF